MDFMLEGPAGEQFMLSGPDNAAEDPFERAARRQRETVQPSGGRQEGAATRYGIDVPGTYAAAAGVDAAQRFVIDPLVTGARLTKEAAGGQRPPDPNLDPEGFQSYIGDVGTAAGAGMAGMARLPGGGAIGQLGVGGGRLSPALEWRHGIADRVMEHWRETGVEPGTGLHLRVQIADAMRDLNLETRGKREVTGESTTQVEAGQVADVIDERLRKEGWHYPDTTNKQKEMPLEGGEVRQRKPSLPELESLHDQPSMRERLYRDAFRAGRITSQELEGFLGALRSQRREQDVAAPAIIAPERGFLGGNESATSAFREHISPYMSEKDFSNNYFSGMWNEEIEFTVKYGGKGIVLDFDGPLYIKGEYAGKIHRLILPEQMSAYNAYFKLVESFQGKGIAKAMLAGQVDIYQKMGFDHVGVFASLDGGSHAWAKFGFLPYQDNWDILRLALARKLRRVQSQLHPEMYEGVLAALRSNDPTIMWSLSDMIAPVVKDRESGKDFELGKYLLRGDTAGGSVTVDWNGSLKINDQDSMDRFWSYVERKPNK